MFQRRLPQHPRPRLLDEAAQITAADVHAHADVTPAILAADARAAESRADPGQGFQRHGDAAIDRDAQFADLLHVVAIAQRQAHHHVDAALAFPQRGDGAAADRGLEDVLEFTHAHAVAGQFDAVGADPDLRQLTALHDSQIGDARHLGDAVLDGQGALGKRVQILAVELHRDLPELPADVLVHVVADGLREVHLQAGDVIHHAFQILDDLGQAVTFGRPLVLGLEAQEELQIAG